MPVRACPTFPARVVSTRLSAPVVTMFPLRYLQLDVFSAGPGGGNKLGVVFGASHWSGAQMQRFAAWTQLVETTFVLPTRAPQASYRLRIFMPHKEIPFAGHPSIGSAHAVLQTGWARPRDGQLLQECGAGILPIRVDEAGAGPRDLYIRTPQAHIMREGADALGALAPVLDGQPLGQRGGILIEGGRRWWLAEFADAAQLRAWQPDHAAMTALAQSSQSMGLCAFARTRGLDHDLVVRAFPAGAGIVEDPASGAANGLIAACIAQREPQGPLARGYCVSQGREMGHDARLMVRIDDDGQVWVGGCTHTIIDGQLAWHARPAEHVEPLQVAAG